MFVDGSDVIIGCSRRIWLGWDSCTFLSYHINNANPRKKKVMWEKMTKVTVEIYSKYVLGLGESVG